MSQTPENPSISTGNRTEGAEVLENTTAKNPQELIADSLNPAEVLLPQNNKSPSPVKITTSDSSDKVPEDSSVGTENGTADRIPTMKKRKLPAEEQDGSSTMSDDSKLVNIITDSSTSDESISNLIVTEKDTEGRVPNLKIPKPFTIIDDQDESTISEDAKLSYIVADLSTSDESKLGDSSKLEVSIKEDSKSEHSAKSEDTKSGDSSNSEDSSKEDSISKESSKSGDSKSEDSSKSDDSTTEDTKSESNSTNTAKEQSSEETEISNPTRYFRKKKPSICEEKESSDSDKETLSSSSTHKEPVGENKSKIHSETIPSNGEEFYTQISDDSKDSNVKSPDGSLEDVDSSVSGADNAKQELSSRKRKINLAGGATEDADSEEETSSDGDSHKSIKKRKKLTKMHK